MRADYVIVGGGIAGACAAYHLAADGRETLLIERGDSLAPKNPRSSSGDVTKCFRAMYGGDRNMTRLSKASFAWWQRFQDEGGEEIFTPCGLVAFGASEPAAPAYSSDPAPARWLAESTATMKAECVPFEVLTKTELVDRYPQLCGSCAYDHALLDKSAGILQAAKGVRTVGKLAVCNGAEICTDTALEKVVRDGDRIVRLETSRGDITVEKSVILTAGYMNVVFAPELRPKVCVSRQQVIYFQAGEDDAHGPDRLPIVIDLSSWRYVIPRHQGIVKVADDANHLPEKVIDPTTWFDQRADAWFEEDARSFLRAFVPGLADTAVRDGRACLYTNTVNEQYLIYARGNSVVVSACSGHGFKNGPMTGLIAARLACGQPCDWYFDAFRYENAVDVYPAVSELRQ
jgi:sarcosine oxidase